MGFGVWLIDRLNVQARHISQYNKLPAVAHRTVHGFELPG